VNSIRLRSPAGCWLAQWRAHLLETHQIKERAIHKDELSIFSKVFLVNSVRKWMEVEIRIGPTL